MKSERRARRRGRVHRIGRKDSRCRRRDTDCGNHRGGTRELASSRFGLAFRSSGLRPELGSGLGLWRGPASVPGTEASRRGTLPYPDHASKQGFEIRATGVEVFSIQVPVPAAGHGLARAYRTRAAFRRPCLARERRR
ncbi:hypothetical protein X976_5372 [Burkholderia pseudomallei MSHR7500]|nr:hypothetical protein DR60_6048 [Burkholderia pseudomallei]KGS86151.1 hypothetical protein X976_5372 [Burkholderia pseudomallei MSHR7500]